MIDRWVCNVGDLSSNFEFNRWFDIQERMSEVTRMTIPAMLVCAYRLLLCVLSHHSENIGNLQKNSFFWGWWFFKHLYHWCCSPDVSGWRFCRFHAVRGCCAPCDRNCRGDWLDVYRVLWERADWRGCPFSVVCKAVALAGETDWAVSWTTCWFDHDWKVLIQPRESCVLTPKKRPGPGIPGSVAVEEADDADVTNANGDVTVDGDVMTVDQRCNESSFPRVRVESESASLESESESESRCVGLESESESSRFRVRVQAFVSRVRIRVPRRKIDELYSTRHLSQYYE